MKFSAEKIAQLRKLSAKVRRLPKVVAAKVALAVAEEITDLAHATFDAGQTPYGDTWKPRKDGKAATLNKTGTLERGIRFVAAGGRIRVRLGVSYAKFQIGKRPVFPRKGQALPASYLEVLRTAAREIMTAEVQS